MCGCLLLTACSGPVEIDTPDLDAADRAACEGFVDDLPATLDDEKPVETDPEDPLGAAAEVLLAFADGEAVGFAVYFFNFSTWLARPPGSISRTYLLNQPREGAAMGERC